MREILERLQGGFDTKVRRSIEHAADQLRALAKKPDESGARKHEQDVLDGLIRLAKEDPRKFVYSVLEILGVRGAYQSKRYGAGER